MDHPQSSPRMPSASDRTFSLVDTSLDVDHSNSRQADAAPASRLALVQGDLLLAHPVDSVPAHWQNAIDDVTQALSVDTRWVPAERPVGLIEKARRAVGSSADAPLPVFAPWLSSSPTALQLGQANLLAPQAKWVASYLFDFGLGEPRGHSPIDLMVMSPCPGVCETQDAMTGSIPRMHVMASMVRAAMAEGRKRIVVITKQAARATVATRLLAADASFNQASLEIEFLSLEEAVTRVQRGAPDWHAVIAMPDLRGVVFAMLAEAVGVTGAWPCLWFDRDLCLVSSETLSTPSGPDDLDASALMQSLALLAQHSGRLYAAERLYQGWAVIRDSGVTTALRTSSAPYVNEITEHAFIDLVTQNRAYTGRALPVWKSIASQDRGESKAKAPARLSLVASQ